VALGDREFRLQLAHGFGDQQARAGSLQRHPQGREESKRRLELPPSRLRVDAGGGGVSPQPRAARLDRPAAELRPQLGEPLPTLSRPGRFALDDLRLANDLHQLRAGEPIVADAVECSLCDCRSELRLLPRELNPGAHERHTPLFVETDQEPLGLLAPALCQPELGEGRQRQPMNRRERAPRHIQCRLQLSLGLGPVPRRHEHAAVEGAAVGVEERAAVAFGEAVRGAHPLQSPFELGAADAGADHVAARVDNGVEAAPLAAQGAGHRLVERV
jgi:hypothetical protein